MKNKPNFNTIWIQPQKPENFDNLDHDLEYKRNNYGLPSVKQSMVGHCTYPWNSITVDQQGRIFLCRCDGWLPFPVGHVLDFMSFDEIFNSTQAKKIQKSIIDKTYEFCATSVCNFNTRLNDEAEYISLNITIDISCNLSCPSCRERLIFINDDELLLEKMSWVDRMGQWVNQSDRSINVIYGGGDPLASLFYKKTFELFANNTNVNFNLMTNGLLVKTHFQIIDAIFDRICFTISIDAATKKTYEQVRRGGKWGQLLENLEFLKSKNKQSKAMFVIQQDNFKEIPQFIDFCKEYALTPYFTLLEDWGTWHNFKEHCVHISDSPNYEEFLRIIKDHNIKI